MATGGSAQVLPGIGHKRGLRGQAERAYAQTIGDAFLGWNEFGSADAPTSRPLSGDARWHQMAPPENLRIGISRQSNQLRLRWRGVRTTAVP